MVPDADLRIKLPVFEGPLDLLLFLIRKNELDIYDIPIATVTKQYIEVLRSMRELDLDIAGEFFVMAASLMEIKSRMLLPRGQAASGENEEEDPLDPRWELVHQLLQYKKFKEAAAKLAELAAFQRDLLARHVSALAIVESERPLKPVDRIELWNAFNIVLRRLAEKLVVGEIKGEEVTVSDKMEDLLEIVRTKRKFLFTDLFEGKVMTVRLLVATFIAVLELTRLRKLRVRQDEAYADIHVEAVDENDPGPVLLPPDPAPETVTTAVSAVAAAIEDDARAEPEENAFATDADDTSESDNTTEITNEIAPEISSESNDVTDAPETLSAVSGPTVAPIETEFVEPEPEPEPVIVETAPIEATPPEIETANEPAPEPASEPTAALAAEVAAEVAEPVEPSLEAAIADPVPFEPEPAPEAQSESLSAPIEDAVDFPSAGIENPLESDDEGRTLNP